jgi:hypothetical protein
MVTAFDAVRHPACDARALHRVVRQGSIMTAERMLDGISDAAATMRKHRQFEQDARDDLRVIVKAAVDAGVPVTRITRAAGWSQRASVYNLLKGR